MIAQDKTAEAGPQSPFDELAELYDRDFTETLLGRLHRDAVMRRLTARFKPGANVLELGCGTGEDAAILGRSGVRVLATDPSEAMVRVARRKVFLAGLSSMVTVEPLAAEALQTSQLAQSGGPFDGAFSNFGALNCVADLKPVVVGLAHCVRPGGMALVCLMGPHCPWEWGWYVLRGRPSKAFRRLKPGGFPWRSTVIHYPSIRAVRHQFAPEFRLLRANAIGTLVPPPYAVAWAERRLALVQRLSRIERRWETAWPLPWLADHFLLEFERL